jgi:hypothetical protein
VLEKKKEIFFQFMSKSIEYQKISPSSDESHESPGEMNVNVSNIPSSQSSAQLIRNNLGNSESVLNESGTINDDKTLERRSRLDSVSSSRIGNGYSSVTSKEWFTVAVLCFINLINYMDRFTIAGKVSLFCFIFTVTKNHFPLRKKKLYKLYCSSRKKSFSQDFDFGCWLLSVSAFH